MGQPRPCIPDTGQPAGGRRGVFVSTFLCGLCQVGRCVWCVGCGCMDPAGPSLLLRGWSGRAAAGRAHRPQYGPCPCPPMATRSELGLFQATNPLCRLRRLLIDSAMQRLWACVPLPAARCPPPARECPSSAFHYTTVLSPGPPLLRQRARSWQTSGVAVRGGVPTIHSFLLASRVPTTNLPSRG